ncbi:Lrp/AsnC family transcriptional regulator [Polycladidibacter stylochi]|uniref:Lrp/AsnC family transcriptional regulator n=1 Tax=Polycladidibacter stylochi TaxID=1807766 RepID=UPI0008296F73|nr:Lrp/AsnC family transcriptional regulator [Pseudovibrio stylochi]
MDNVDQKILAALRLNARMSLTKLAAHLGMTRATVRARIQRLERSGAILGYTLVTVQDQEPAPVRAVCMIRVEGMGAEDVLEELLQLSELGEIHTTNGNWDLIATINVISLTDLDQALTRLRRIKGIEATETSLLLSTRRAQHTLG